MTRDWMVATLLLLYPAAWRRDYGEELAGVLLERPLSPRVIADVVSSGLGLRARAAEPSTILGVASMLIILGAFVLAGDDTTAVLRPSAMTLPAVTVRFLDSDIYAFLLIGCGYWTYLRHRGTAKRSGVAAMKMSLIAGMPIMAGALLMTAAVLDLRVPGAPVHPPSAWDILVAPLSRLPGSWPWGSVGGQVGKWMVRRQTRAAASSCSCRRTGSSPHSCASIPRPGGASTAPSWPTFSWGGRWARA